MRHAKARKSASTANKATKSVKLVSIPTDAVVESAVSMSDRPWLAPIVRFLDATGLRIGEVTGTDKKYTVKGGSQKWTLRRGLTLGDVADSVDGAWKVRSALTVVGKGDKSRTIPLTAHAKAAIAELISLFGGDSGDYLLVPLTQRTISRELAKVKALAKVTSTLTPHTMRHRAITKIVQSGEIKVAQMFAGHSDPKVTLAVYTHITWEDMVSAVNEAGL